jgi:nucleotide-binding universal stress UspA family protein
MQTTMERDTLETAAETFHRILVPVDLRVPSQRALRVAIELRHRFGAQVCVFHVVRTDENDHFLAGIGSPVTRSDLLEGGRADVRQFVRDVVPGELEAIEVEAKVENDVVTAIRAQARAWDATLVILSSEHHPSLRRTHSEKLSKSLAIPVLLLEPPPVAKKA